MSEKRDLLCVNVGCRRQGAWWAGLPGRRGPGLLVALALLGFCGAALAQVSEPGAPVRLSVSGRVLAAAGGVPRPGSGQVLLVAERSRFARLWEAAGGEAVSEEILGRATWNADGFFQFDAQLRSAARLRILAAGYAPLERRVLPVPAEQHFPTARLQPVVAERLRVVPPAEDSEGESPPARMTSERDAGGGPGRSWVVLAGAQGAMDGAGSDASGWSRAPLFGWAEPQADGAGEFYFERSPGEELRFFASNVWGRELIVVGPESGRGSVRHDPVGVTRRVTLRLDAASEGPTVVLVDGRPAGRLHPGGGLGLAVGTLSKVEVLASRAHQSWRRSPAAVSSPAEAEVELEPWPRLRGAVRALGSGKALPGAWIVAGAETSRSDAQGRFQIAVPPGRSVLVGAPGYAWQELAASDEAQVDVELLRAQTLTGRVVDTRGGPLEGIEVEVAERGFEAPLVSRVLAARTGRGGTFRILGLRPQASWRLVAKPEGGRLASSALFDTEEEGTALPAQQLVVRWPRPAMGWVVDSQDRPVGGASVVVAPADPPAELRDEQGQPILARARTDHSGQFQLADLPYDRFHLFVRADGFAPATVRDFAMPEAWPTGERARNGAAEIGTVELGTSLVLELLLEDGDGQPVEGATVLYRGRHVRWPADDVPAWELSGRPSRSGFLAHPIGSDARGSVRIAGFGVDEEVSLQIEHRDFVTRVLGEIELPQEEPMRVQLVWAAVVSGRTVDAQGGRLADAHVAIRAADSSVALPAGLFTRSGADGRFRLVGVPPGDMVVWGRAPGAPDFVEVPVAVVEGELLEGIVLRAPESATLGGVVRRAGRPVPGAKVSCCALATTTDARGEYLFEAVPLGRQTVHAADQDGAAREAVAEVLGGRRTDLDLDLDEGLTLSGRVVSFDGRPLTEGSVRLWNTAGQTPRRERRFEEAGGAFSFRGLRAGDYELSAFGRLDGIRHGASERIVLAADQHDLEIVLGGRAAIRGQVVGLNGVGFGALEVWARHDFMPQSVAVTADGTFELNNLDDGKWQVRAKLSDGREVAESFSLAEGEMRSLVLDFGRETLRLDLQVSVDGAPAAAWVAAFGPHGESIGETLNGQGRATLQRLSPGSWSVSLAEPQGALVPVWSGSITSDRILELRLERVRVSGRVIAAADGQPIAGARVSLASAAGEQNGRRSRVASDTFGAFTITALVDGGYRLMVEAPGYAASELALVGSSADLLVSLHRE